MNELLANPKALFVLLCLGGVVLGPFFTLFGLWRRDKAVIEEASKWGKALSGPRDGQQRQAAQLSELHSLVSNLKASDSDKK